MRTYGTFAKNIARLVAFAIKGHDKTNAAFFAGKDFDEETCEETDPVSHRGALDKYDQQRDKLLALGICPPCLDGAGIDALAASALSQLDAANLVVYPCGLAP